MIFILTLTWNAASKLEALKSSLEPAMKGLEYTWLIKDNCSNDDTVKKASSWNNTKVFAYPDNKQNFSEGMNYLFKQIACPSDNDYILLLNNDVIIDNPRSIRNMLSIMEKDKQVGCVGAKLTYTNTNKIQHAGVVFDNRYMTPTHFRVGAEDDALAGKNREFQVVTGAVLLTSVKNFKSAYVNKNGNVGLDEELIWCFDDVDYCLSVKYNLNKKIVYCGQTKIYHEESASLKKNPINLLFMNKNIKYFLNKWRGRYKIDKQDYENDPKLNLYEIK